MKGTFKIEIDKSITEQNFIEGCLNMKYSGVDWRIAFFFYALGQRWHINKFNYYFKMLEEVKK